MDWWMDGWMVGWVGVCEKCVCVCDREGIR